MKPTIYLMRGLPAAGKTTESRAMVAEGKGRLKRVCKDDLRAMMDQGAHLRDQWETVERLRDGLVDQLLTEGYSVVLDETFLPPGSIERVQVRFGHRAGVVIVNLTHVPLAVCIERDSKRDRVVGRENIETYFGMMTPEEQRRAMGADG